MQKNIYRVFKRSIKAQPTLNLVTFVLLMGGINSLSHAADSPFASAADFTAASCPSGDKIYYIGSKAPAGSSSQSLSWTAAALSKSFTFTEPSGNKVFNISFSAVVDKNNAQGGNVPFYGNINGATVDAINLAHNSLISNDSKTNHILSISVNRSVTKIGYKIQDVDSTTSNNKTPYIEQVDISAQAGQLTSNSNFHTINPGRTIVTAIKGKNCGAGGCTIDATWDYNIADSLVSLKHNNVKSESDSPHAVAYSDFYFCLAPPKVIIKKELIGPRINDTNTKRDQFDISIKTGTTTLSSFTTTGTGQVLANNTSAVTTLKEATSYTIAERVLNGSTVGNINDYNASYICTNATTGSTSTMPSGTGSSFALSNLNYGDEVTCTITNTPKPYVFSGTVFNDNGGIAASDLTKQNVSSTFTGNNEYFNGVFDRNKEKGLADSSLTVRLTNCGSNGGTNITTSSPNPQTVSSAQATLGQYSFIVEPNTLTNKTQVCLIESEPLGWRFSVDTTANTREVPLAENVYSYLNLDFGEVETNNTALVLKKYQYVHECDDTLNYTATNINSPNIAQPTTGFSLNAADNIKPGNCIAYKIEAYNRGHVDLASIQISDILQKAVVKSVFHLPTPLGSPANLFKSTNQSAVMGQNGTIVSDQFNLSKTPQSSTTATKAILYFNSKYGSIPSN